MKTYIRLFLFIVSIGTSISGCLKDNSSRIPAIDCSTETTMAPANETSTLKQQLDSLGISTAVQDSRGFFYKMDSNTASATGPHATTCSNVAVTYSIARLGDTIFEKSDSVIAVSLHTTNIIGLKAAIPLMKKGAIMNLYLPPSLAYGSSGYRTVPGNTYIMFTIKLYDFTN